MTAEQPFDLSAPGFTDDPYPQYAALREKAPVYQHPLGFWVVTRYEDVSWLLRAELSVEGRNIQQSPITQARQTLKVPGLSMLDRDPPHHTRLRKLVSKAFTPRAVQELRPRVSELVDGMLDAAAATGRVDLVPALAFPLPFTVIAEMLGIPPADHVRIRELTGTLVKALEPVADPGPSEAIKVASIELTGITADMIAWKRKHPASDLITALISAEEDGDVLDEGELIAQVLLLYAAGHETTVGLIAGGTAALLRNPDQMARLRHDPALVGNAVEELLRYDSPVQIRRRITLQPVTIRGITIPEGTSVVACLASANRDESYWGRDAAELRLNRDNARQHVSFGAGPHHCLGASLARMEAAIALGRLAARFPNLTLDGEVTWNGRINLRGPSHLPVTVR
jgi:cytochrome P450